MIHNADESLSGHRNMLNNEQLKTFNWIVQTSGFAGVHGHLEKVGSEKSFLLKYVEICLLNKRIPHFINAATGIVALLIGDRTLYSPFGIVQLKNRKLVSSAKVNNILRKSLMRLQF